MMNGTPVMTELDPLEAAKRHLVETIFKAPVEPQSLAVNAYVNSIMQTVRTDALYEFLTTDKHAGLDKGARMNRLLLDSFERASANIVNAQRAAPRILTSPAVGRG